jgi:lactate dehydrogenase-like 2-hydroxyacid dehydrogenase
MAAANMDTKTKHKVVFTTDRGDWHQQTALAASPENLAITMLRAPDKPVLIAALQDAEFLISERFGVIDAEIIQQAPKLKLIQRLGSLVYDINLEAASQSGITVCYQPVAGVISVAEHLIMQILVLSKKLREVEAIALAASPDWGESLRTDEDTFAYNWSGRLGVNQVWQRAIGIIGFGEIGAEFSRRMKGWDCTILYNKRTRLPERVEADLGLTYVSQETLFNRSDILVNLLPFVPGTEMLLNADVFTKLKTGAYLVSCGSGSTIDETALADAIRTGKIAGAALDTFEYEPIRANNPLIAAAKEGFNILLTPHTAAGTADHEGQIPDRSEDYRNITRFLNNESLAYQIV